MRRARPAARHLAGALALALLVAGCAGVAPAPPSAAAPSDAERLLVQAEDLARQGRADAARAAYAGAADAPGPEAVRARALRALARLHLDPAAGAPDYTAARSALERLLATDVTGDWRPDAQAWHALLARLGAEEARAERAEAEARRLRGELGARAGHAARARAELHAREAEVARLRDETARLRTALDRLRQIDLDVERRR